MSTLDHAQRVPPPRQYVENHPYRRREHSPSSALARVSVGPAGSGSTTSYPQPAARSLASEDSSLASQVPDQPDQSFIVQFYDVDRSGNHTLGATLLDSCLGLTQKMDAKKWNSGSLQTEQVLARRVSSLQLYL